MGVVAGVVSINGSLLPSELVGSLITRGRRRGVLESNTKLLGPAALGSAALHITSEDVGQHQPVSSPDGRTTIVFDGRLDNRDELLDILSPSTPDRSCADVQVALQAYERWGEGCVAKLVGAFAFIIWDSASRRMFCAVDHLALRPLFYSRQSNNLIVASTIHQILGHRAVSREFDDAYMLGTLCLRPAAPLWTRHTPYKAIQRLPPGRTMTVGCDGDITVRRYWRPERLAPMYNRSSEYWAEEVRNLFTAVVRAQSRSNSGVFSTFSGGLDSSSITCIAALLRRNDELLCERLRSGWLTVPLGSEGDERAFRQGVIDRYNLSTIEVSGESSWQFSGFRDEVPFPDEIFGTYLAYRQLRACADAARDSGCNVVLYGFGGDELMGGSDFFLADYVRRGHLGKALRGLRGRVHLANTSYASALQQLVIAPLIPSQVWHARRTILKQRSGRWDPQAEWYRLMVPPWLDVDACLHSGLVETIWSQLPERWTQVPSQSFVLTGVGVAREFAFYDDYAFMPFGCEARAPFLDRRMIELSLQIPDELKSRVASSTRISKLILRRAMRGILPEDIRLRLDKASSNRDAWVGVHRAWALLLNSSRFEVVERGYVAEDRLRHFLALWRLGNWEYDPQISNLLLLEFWLRGWHDVYRAESSIPAHS